jgi:hypothetical protein
VEPDPEPVELEPAELADEDEDAAVLLDRESVR